MRYVIFYEGDSERNMFNHALFKSPNYIDLTEDIEALLSTPDNQHCVFFYNCGGYQNVFPLVQRNAQLYADEETTLLIVRDLEKTPCFSGLRDEMNDACPTLTHRARVLALFSKPEFEQVYFADLDLLERVFADMYRTRMGRDVPDRAELHNRIQLLDDQRPSKSIRRLFRDYGLAYNKPELSDFFFAQYFSRPDFRETTNPYILRVLTALNGLMALPR